MPFLDRQYTVFGKVISGMEFVDKIKKGDSNNNGSVENPDKIISFKFSKFILMALKKFSFNVSKVNGYARLEKILTIEVILILQHLCLLEHRQQSKELFKRHRKNWKSNNFVNIYHLMIRPGVNRLKKFKVA